MRVSSGNTRSEVMGRVEIANDHSDESERNHNHFIDETCHLSINNNKQANNFSIFRKNDNHHHCHHENNNNNNVLNATDKSADTVKSWFKQMKPTHTNLNNIVCNQLKIN